MDNVLLEVHEERVRQDVKFGPQNHPDGTGHDIQKLAAKIARDDCDEAFRLGKGTWADILSEEVNEAFAKVDPIKLRTELLQVAAVSIAWIEAIDRRTKA